MPHLTQGAAAILGPVVAPYPGSVSIWPNWELPIWYQGGQTSGAKSEYNPPMGSQLGALFPIGHSVLLP